MAWMLEILLHVNHVIVEGRPGLGLGNGNRRRERGFSMYDAHAAATTATRGFNDDRVTDVARDAHILVDIFAQRAIRTRDTRHAG